MNFKMYSSYEQVDRDLEILKLQRDIAYEKLSLSVEKTIENLTPGSMIQNVLGNVGSIVNKYDLLQKIVIPLLLRRLLK
ncbi:DUF6327 family protein [Flavobacterium sp. SM15]|uniref:DUF6327 family protein n=1 Tax=Flavobacterium sp. SM15 TaxID=2908005 RepID=UPI001EDC67B4|nr:DUF6327 family protein [Flavobacterium sp. SM15]MCG2610398.1 DUF6327 family protein [Flavobacterium sp. SM15]